ncbi:MAG: HAMP domain-containing protein [Spirochaetota bacterium]
MRIRTKLGIVELILVAGFLIAIGVVVFFTNTIINLKDFEVQSNVIMSSLRRMNYQTQSLLTTRTPIIEISVQWTNTINEFERDLEGLSRYSNLRVLNDEQERQMAELTGWWDQIYEWYYKPAIDHLQKMQNGPAGDAVGSQGILRTLLELESSETTPPDYLGELYTIRNYRDHIMDETQTFSARLTDLTTSIQRQIDSNIQQSRRIVIGLIILTIIVTIFITVRFAHLMGSRIRQVEQAMRHLARGDFSTQLNIKSKDEFEELSENYNILKTQLQEKLNSVLGFMVDISNSLAEGPKLQRIMNIIANSAVENTDADGAALYLVDSEAQLLVPQVFSGDFIPPFPLPEEATVSKEKALEYAKETKLKIGENAIGTSRLVTRFTGAFK